MRKSAISIPSNIAEGSGRGTDKDFAHFINISLGSAFELETQIILAFDLQLMSYERLNELTEKLQEIQKMLVGLNKKFSNI